MAQKSIVDRVLMLAAVLCASALAWQLTVLLTSKGHSAGPTRSAAAVTTSAPPAPARSAEPSAPIAAQAAPAQTVRVVYPGPDTGEKTSLKASDPPAPTPAAAPSTPAVAAALPVPPEPASPAPMPVAAPASGLQAAAPAPTGTDKSEPSVEPSPSVEPTPAVSVDIASAEPPTPADHADPATASPAAPDGAIDLNHASIDALNHLRGAGRVGQAIISHRPYRSVEDLVKKRVLRRDVYEQIRQQVVTQ